MDSRRKKMEEGKESNAKRHLPLPRTVKISIACFFHVDDGNVLLFCFFLVCFFVFCFFSRGGKKTLELYLLLWFCMWGRKCRLIEEPDRHLVGPQFGRLSLSSRVPPLSCWERGCLRDVLWGWPSACSTHRAAGTMGHGPFHCIAPSLTSLAAVFMVIDTLAAPPVARSITWPQHTSDRIYWITLPVLNYGCVCVCMPVYVSVCAANKYWRTLATVSMGRVNVCCCSSSRGHNKFHIQILIGEFEKIFSLLYK